MTTERQRKSRLSFACQWKSMMTNRRGGGMRKIAEWLSYKIIIFSLAVVNAVNVLFFSVTMFGCGPISLPKMFACWAWFTINHIVEGKRNPAVIKMYLSHSIMFSIFICVVRKCLPDIEKLLISTIMIVSTYSIPTICCTIKRRWAHQGNSSLKTKHSSPKTDNSHREQAIELSRD